MPDLSAQMDAVCHRFEELSVRLNQPDAAADPALFRKLMRDYHETQPVVQAYRDWQTARDHLAQAKALLEEPISDPDFKQMIQQEISEKSQDVAKLENNLKILLLPRDPRDEKNVIMEIRGGAGGEEAALFAHSLLRMYTMYVQSRGWTLELLNLNETELGGVKEAIFLVEGAGAYNRLKYESGVHRVQRVPETETQVVLPLLESDLLKIMAACTEGTLADTEVKFSEGAACCVILASGGYPVSYEKGKPISGLTNGQLEGESSITVYHSGTALREDGTLVTNGGRVLGVTATAPRLTAAITQAYAAAEKISFEKLHKRTDIGMKALKAIAEQ